MGNNVIEKLIQAATLSVLDFDYVTTTENIALLIKEINKENVLHYQGDLLQLVKNLRACLSFDNVVLLTEHLKEELKVDNTDINQQYGQALVELGKFTKAIDIFEKIEESTSKGTSKYSEAVGLLGRVYKQKFVNNSDTDDPTRVKDLEQSIQYYSEAYEFDSDTYYWHGINLTALVARAERENITIKYSETSQSLGEKVLGSILRLSENDHDAWASLTATEACVALQDWGQAYSWFQKFINNGVYDHFALNSFLRQLKEVWGFDSHDPEAGKFIHVLQAQLSQRQYGGISISPQAMENSADVSEEYYEKVLGNIGCQTYTWWQAALKRAKSVCLIKDQNDEPVGTGFLVKGSDLCENLPDEMYVLTNEHVVSQSKKNTKALQPEYAKIDFTLCKGRKNKVVRVEKIEWQSSSKGGHDATLIKPTAVPLKLSPLPLSFRLPLINEEQRVNIVGHPGGRKISFSIQDNKLIDYEGPDNGEQVGPEVRRIHYRAPTEGGSSGSPVFNQSTWEVIGLHHAGSKNKMQRLNGKPGFYSANEAIWIHSIAKAIKHHFV